MPGSIKSPKFMERYGHKLSARGAVKYRDVKIDTPEKYKLVKRVSYYLAYRGIFDSVSERLHALSDKDREEFNPIYNAMRADIESAGERLRAAMSEDGSEGREADPFFVSIEREFQFFARRAKDLGLLDVYKGTYIKSRHISDQIHQLSRKIFFPQILNALEKGEEATLMLAKPFVIGPQAESFMASKVPESPKFMKIYSGERNLRLMRREATHQYKTLAEYKLAKRFAWAESYKMLRDEIVKQMGEEPERAGRFGEMFHNIDSQLNASLRYLRECERDRDFDEGTQRDGSEVDKELAVVEHYFPKLVRLAKDRGILADKNLVIHGVELGGVKSSDLKTLVHQVERKIVFPRFLEVGGRRHSPDDERQEMQESVTDTYTTIEEAIESGVPQAVRREYKRLQGVKGEDLDKLVDPRLRSLTKLGSKVEAGKRVDKTRTLRPLQELVSDEDLKLKEDEVREDRFKNRAYYVLQRKIYNEVKGLVYDFVKEEMNSNKIKSYRGEQLGVNAVNKFINERLNPISEEYLGRKLSQEEKDQIGKSFKEATGALGKDIVNSKKNFSYMAAIGAAVANAVGIIFIVGYNLTFERNKGKKWSDFFTLDAFKQCYNPRAKSEQKLLAAVDKELFDMIRHKNLKGLNLIHFGGQKYDVLVPKARPKKKSLSSVRR